ncbi:MAG: histidine kinase [Verrucomicrobia bacterium]|jgi:two-component system, chemotaxis family, sensor kinase Cph1|nr:histidine kinase [Verrucomicrobiota bacterium]
MTEGDEKDRIAELEAHVADLERDFQEFTAVTSHDLMEPARAIAGFLALIEESCGGRMDEGEKRYFKFAVDGASRLQRMLTELLQLSRVRTKGKAFAPVDLNEILSLALDALEEPIGAAECAVSRDVLPVVSGDAVQLLKVFTELIENVLSFAGDARPPHVHVSGAVEDVDGVRTATISFADCGIGIAPKFHDAVFVVFRRLHPRTETSGVGAGLALCKRIVEHHGGRIWVESDSDEGSTFRFSLPCAVATEP